MSGIGRALIIIGVVLIIVGLLFPILNKMGIGHLPGDIHIKRKNFTFYFPIVTCIIISIIISLILWLLRR